MPAPPQGFIKIYPDTVSIVQALNGWSLNSDPTPMPARTAADLEAYFDARVVNAAVAPCFRRDFEEPAASGVYAPGVNTYELSFSPSTRGIQFFANSLNNPPDATLDLISAEFPMGLSINQAAIWWDGLGRFNPARQRDIGDISWKFNGATYNVMTLTGGWGGQTTPPFGAGAIIPDFFTHWSILQLMKSWGLSVPVTASGISGGLTPEFVISDFYLYAIYNTLQFQYTTSTPEALPGDIATIESPTDSMDLFEEEGFRVYWDAQPGDEESPDFPGFTGGIFILRKYILIFNSTTFKFVMPYDQGVPYGGRRLMVVGTGTGTIFSGMVPLQNYNVTLVDGSGLYKLTPGKRNDTYYDRSSGPPTPTIDLRIPDPRAKTGFFNG